MGSSNVYTVLILIATLALLASTIYLVIVSGDKFEGGLFSTGVIDTQFVQQAFSAVLSR